MILEAVFPWIAAGGIGLLFILVMWAIVELMHRRDQQEFEMVVGDVGQQERRDVMAARETEPTGA